MDGSGFHKEGQHLAAGWQHLAGCWQHSARSRQQAPAGTPQDTASFSRTQQASAGSQQASAGNQQALAVARWATVARSELHVSAISSVPVIPKHNQHLRSRVWRD
ncbi:hypothetical protein QL285_003548 [Trifolium repens]|nr:hypothetical protein QL285_003548 [Trifolium repens]